MDHSPNEEYRITFLVNVWVDHKPAGVHRLPNEIRDVLKRTSNDSICVGDKLSCARFESCQIAERFISMEEEVRGAGPSRIDLPFLGKNTTWGEDGDPPYELVVSMYTPTARENEDNDSTILYRFAADVCAYVYTPTSETMDEEDDDE